MEMPRPSIAATGSSLCIYYLACDDDTMERICGMPNQTLERLVKYVSKAIWDALDFRLAWIYILTSVILPDLVGYQAKCTIQFVLF